MSGGVSHSSSISSHEECTVVEVVSSVFRENDNEVKLENWFDLHYCVESIAVLKKKKKKKKLLVSCQMETFPQVFSLFGLFVLEGHRIFLST